MSQTSYESNVKIFETLTGIAQKRYINNNGENGNISIGPLEIHDFSICFWMENTSNQERKGIYVKIPKASITKETMLPITNDDRRLAEEEYKSLLYLSKYWNGDDIDVQFIKVLGFIPEYNAIITERAYGDYLLDISRKTDLIGRLKKSGKPNSIHDSMFRLGTALSRFHRVSIKKGSFDADKTVEKIRSYCSELEGFGIDQNYHRYMVDKIYALRGFNCKVEKANTLKGLDVRNVLIDGSNRLYMIDPGRLKEDCIESDIARFIVTNRILYWGSMAFFLRLSPNLSYEKSFINGYYQHEDGLDKLLSIFIIKELIKHWRTAHVALQLKRWPKMLKRVLKVSYINPFYVKQISREFTVLG